MTHEDIHGFDPELVYRYFDGDLSASERRQAEALLESSAEARDLLADVERAGDLLRAEVTEWQGQLSDADGDALFARISAAIHDQESDGSIRRSEAPRPQLRVLPGGRGRYVAGVAVTLAAAAAMMLAALGDLRGPDPSRATSQLQRAGTGRGSQVVAVDFGGNTGTHFTVEGQAGQPLAVVWISDQVDKP